MAVRVCHAAGEGARINLRFGGKSCAGIGDPIDAEVLVRTIQDNATRPSSMPSCHWARAPWSRSAASR
jgi:microcystin degradation protein MlrC